MTAPVISMLRADIHDTRAERHEFSSWERFELAFTRPPRWLSAATRRWSAATYSDGLRSQASCELVYHLVLDVDGKLGGATRRELERLPFGFVAHTTKSDTEDRRCWRVVGRLAQPVTLEEHRAVYEELRPSLPNGTDPQSINAVQPWLCPAMPPSGRFEAFTHRAPALDPAPLLLAYAERIEREELERAKERPVDPSTAERRAIAYIEKMDPAISGAGGHTATFRAAAKLVEGFGLDELAALRILRDHFNPRCLPPWKERDLVHKVRSAAQQTRVIRRVEDRPQ